jgi:hypothetical protein
MDEKKDPLKFMRDESYHNAAKPLLVCNPSLFYNGFDRFVEFSREQLALNNLYFELLCYYLEDKLRAMDWEEYKAAYNEYIPLFHPEESPFAINVGGRERGKLLKCGSY